MVLLTSSQVSVAISSLIVVSFTTALFLSGYVLQQATVRDLRAAIKPQMVRPPPELQLSLQPQFRDEDLDQRGIVDATPVEVEKFSHIQEENPVSIAAVSEKEGNSNEGSKTGADDEEDMIGATRWQKEQRRKQRLLANSEQAQKPLKREGAKAKVTQKGSGASTQSTKDAKTKAAQKPLSKAERRKKIKEEILAAGEGESYQGYRRRKW